MPEHLDVIGHFEEERRGDVHIRVAPIEPPAHPLGPSMSEPHWGIFGSALNADPGWVVLFTHPEPEACLDLLGDEELERTERLSLLIGASWRVITTSVARVRVAQEAALQLLPPLAWNASLDELRRIRPLLNSADPCHVATLMGIMHHWSSDPGGTRGPTYTLS